MVSEIVIVHLDSENNIKTRFCKQTLTNNMVFHFLTTISVMRVVNCFKRGKQ